VGVGRITPFGSDARVQASVTQVVPKTSTPCASQACDTLYWAITVGSDGSLWIGAGASVDRLSLLPGNKLTRYQVPGAAKYAALDITTGIDGKVWFTGATATNHSAVSRQTAPSPSIRCRRQGTQLSESGPARTATCVCRGRRLPERPDRPFSPFSPGHVTYYPVPNGAVPYGFANGNCDNTIWFTDTSANPSFIGRIQLHTPAGVLGCVYSKFGNAQGQYPRGG
jgi:streptogramin lyase